QAAQVHARRAIAAIVHLRIDRVGLRGEVLDDVADRRQTRSNEIGLVEHRYRRGRGELAPLDRRPGNDDDLRLGLRERRELLVRQIGRLGDRWRLGGRRTLGGRRLGRRARIRRRRRWRCWFRLFARGLGRWLGGRRGRRLRRLSDGTRRCL